MSYRFLASVYDWVAPNFSRYRSAQLLTEKVLQVAPDQCELLDIGVGTGLSIAPYVNSPRFKRIVGVDPSVPMLERCRRKFPSVELHHGTLEDVVPQLVAEFHVVQSCGAVEHVRDLVSFVSQVSILLRSGGHFVFTYEPEIAFSVWQSGRAPHIGTWGRAEVFRRTAPDVHGVLANIGYTICSDFEFKAYLGLVHHLVIARSA
jgi:predicted TPR repeat methyltransferase